MDRREHHRVRLRLPARLRWTAPFGQTTEVSQTLDVSRSGLRVPCNEPHAPGVTLWVTFPYDEALRDGQPEIMARVVRLSDGGAEDVLHSGNAMKDSSVTHAHSEPALAVRFELAPLSLSNGNGHATKLERRASERRPIALPVHVRPRNIPWFEEAMSIDISADGLRFLSSREYQRGQELFVTFEPSIAAPWPPATEHRSTVVRIEAVPDSPALAVTVCRLP